jgi:hypothetical protein
MLQQHSSRALHAGILAPCCMLSASSSECLACVACLALQQCSVLLLPATADAAACCCPGVRTTAYRLTCAHANQHAITCICACDVLHLAQPQQVSIAELASAPCSEGVQFHGLPWQLVLFASRVQIASRAACSSQHASVWLLLLYWWLACLSEPAAELSACLAMRTGTKFHVHTCRCSL